MQCHVLHLSVLLVGDFAVYSGPDYLEFQVHLTGKIRLVQEYVRVPLIASSMLMDQ